MWDLSSRSCVNTSSGVASTSSIDIMLRTFKADGESACVAKSEAPGKIRGFSIWSRSLAYSILRTSDDTADGCEDFDTEAV